MLRDFYLLRGRLVQEIRPSRRRPTPQSRFEGPARRAEEPPVGSGRTPQEVKPLVSAAFDGVSEGTRTPDTQDHNNAAWLRKPCNPLLVRDS